MRARRVAVWVGGTIVVLLVLATAVGWRLWRGLWAPSAQGEHYSIVVENLSRAPLVGLRFIGPAASVAVPDVGPGSARTVRLDSPLMGPVSYEIPSLGVNEELYDPGTYLKGQSATLEVSWTGVRKYADGRALYGHASIGSARLNPSDGPWSLIGGFTWQLQSRR